MSILFEAYKDILKYPLTKHVEPLALDLDYQRISDEILTLIAENNYGYKPVSLRLPTGETRWTDPEEDLISTADGVLKFGAERKPTEKTISYTQIGMLTLNTHKN